MKHGHPFYIILTSISILLVALFLLNISLGSVLIPFKDVIRILSGKSVSDPSWETIVIHARLPGSIAAVLAGAALSLSGLMMQTLFRNPVAGPYILGISSGASLGVAILVLLGSAFGFGIFYTGSWWSSGLMLLMSGGGAFFVFLVMISIAYKVRDITVLLIIGLMIGSAASAIISILQLYTNQQGLQFYVFWTFGSFDQITLNQLVFLVPAVIAGMIPALLILKPMNVLLMGEYYATSMGVEVNRLRIWIIISTSILAGSVTAFCGPIAFIGLAVPHICRGLLRTSDHFRLAPAVLILGPAIALFSNLASNLPGLPYTLPLNAVTPLIGAPVVIWVITRRQYQLKEFGA